MTQTTHTILSQYQVRKTKKQKAVFRDYLKTVAEGEGYACHAEKGSMGAVNMVVGDPTIAKVVYTAHYDTCAKLPVPNFITPKNIGIYLLYQVVISVLLMLLPAVLLSGVVAYISLQCGLSEGLALGVSKLVFGVWLLVSCWLIIAGPANKHTVNDNTSGVTVLVELMHQMPTDLRNDVAFIFFDLEEAGLFGSVGYASKHKKAMSHKLLLNFDCVSDGDHIIFAVAKRAKPYAPLLAKAFLPAQDVQVEVLTKGVFYPSDQANFPCGVGVAALKATKGGKLLYMDRIHTSKDTVYREENITYLVDGCVTLTRTMVDDISI